jgi:hypothetical protein
VLPYLSWPHSLTGRSMTVFIRKFDSKIAGPDARAG